MATFNVRPDIDAAAGRLAATVGSKREIKRLPEVLWENERVEALAAGQYGGGAGLLAMTDRRLLFVKHGVMRQQLEDFPYGRISSVEWRAGLALGTLVVYSSGNKAEIKSMNKQDGKAVADALRQRLAAPTVPAQAAPGAAPGGDVASRLEQLQQLRQAGAISNQEYEAQRQRILGAL